LNRSIFSLGSVLQAGSLVGLLSMSRVANAEMLSLNMFSELPISSDRLPSIVTDGWSWLSTVWQSNPLAFGGAVAGLILLLGLTRLSAKRRDKAKSTSQVVLDALPDAIAIFNPKGQLTAVNQKLKRLLPMELAPATFPDTTSSDLYAQLSPDNLAIERARNQALEAAVDPDSTISFELPSYGRRSLLVKERPTDDGGTAISVYGAKHRMSTRLSDPLTALPNRARLLNELAQRCSRTKDELALIIVDLRSFRQINDIYGREIGDELLKQTGICLQHCMPEDAVIARTAGDEFAVLLEFNQARAMIEQRVARFLATLRHGLNVNTINVPVRASVGIAFAPEHGNTVSTLLTCADSACAHAKRLGNNTLVVYNSEQQLEFKRRHQLEVALQQAIPKNELSLYYQPQVDIATNMTCGMEALLRWNSAEFGRVSPIEFIDIAEQSGSIKPIGAWVLRQAISDYQRLSRFGMSPPTLSVNLSRKQFEGGKVVRDVAKVLHNTKFDPACLCLEITETAVFGDSNAMKKMLHELTSIGVKIAIDDFGVGYSSLLELRDYPINEIKIDRAFVMDVTTNNSSQDIIHAIVDIADSIGADVVAEGIEDQQQFDMVAALGCHRVQGYFLCEPMPATTFPDLVLSA
jgi:diguanylate cyclase (GGDEF)-like protein